MQKYLKGIQAIIAGFTAALLFFVPALAEPVAGSDMVQWFNSQTPVNYYVDVPMRSRPVLYYAQNDPVWENVRYRNRNSEEKRYRTIGSGGCEPVATAIALRYLLSDEQLWTLNEITYGKKGFTFCTCSCAYFHCNHQHEQFKIESMDDMERYLPIALAGFAAGNNPLGRGGYNAINMILSYFDLPYKKGKGGVDAVTAVDNGAIAIINVGTAECPFTQNGHYLTLMGTDETYLYFLDPYLHDYKETDKRQVLELLSPGFVRAKRTDLKFLGITGYLALFPNDTATEQ